MTRLQCGNLNLSKKLCACTLNPSFDVLLTVQVFDSLLHDTSRAMHQLTKIFIGLLRKAGWDLGLVANAIHPNVDYARKGHNQYTWCRQWRPSGEDLEVEAAEEGAEVCDSAVDMEKEKNDLIITF